MRAPYEAVETARWWYDNSRLGYGQLAELVGDMYKLQIGASTVRDWVNGVTRVWA